MAFQRFFTDLSQTATNASYTGIFESANSSSSAIPGWALLDSLSAEGAEIVRWVRYKLGEPVLYVELDNKQIFAAFEESNIKYSSVINTFQIRNWMTNMYGLNKDFTSGDLTNKLPYNNYNFLMRQVENVGSQGMGNVGGSQNVRKAFVVTSQSTQDYNVYDFIDYESGSSVRDYLTSVSGTSNGMNVNIKNIFHFSPTTLYRFYDPYSSVNMLSQDFQFESFNTETIFYVLPIWNDILRAQQLNLNDKVRRSNISYNKVGDVIKIYPRPITPQRLWIEFTSELNPFAPSGSLSGDQSISGISNLSNVPYKDLTYRDVNPLSRHWIRQYTFALCLEELGRIRRKFTSIPIPNGDVNLDGGELVREGIEKQQLLEQQLREDLEKLTNLSLAQQEAEQLRLLNQQLQYFPNRILLF